MSIASNSPGTSANVNAAFMSRTASSTSTVSVVALNNAVASSGASVAEVQRFINSAASALGMTTSQVYNFLFTWASDSVGSANDTVKARVDALVGRFLNASGHNHSGSDGHGPKIDAANLSNMNFYFGEFQQFTKTGASGTSVVVTTELTGKTAGGGASTLGVVTSAPYNKCSLVTSSTGQAIEDSGGQRVYGRITESGGVWTLSFYTNEAGVETAHSLASTDIKVIFVEVFNQNTRPTFGTALTLDINSLDLTADVVDASATQRGVVSTGAQTMSGVKTFVDGIATDTISEKTPAAGVTIDGLLLKDGLADGRDISTDGSTLDTHVGSTSNPHSVTKAQVGLTNVTDDAQLKRAAGDINSFTEKASPVGADILILEDSADSYNKKKVQISNIATASVLDSSYEILNLSISTSVAANALTIAIKDKAGNDPSAGSPVKVGMRNSTLTNGTYNQRSITGALSMTISSGSTLGHTNATEHDIWVYLIDNAGSLELAVSHIKFNESGVITTTAEGGAGAADSASTAYSTTARTSVPFRIIGLLKSTQTTAGTWAAVPTNTILSPSQKNIEQIISSRYTTNAGQTVANTGYTIIDFGTKDWDYTGAVSGAGASWRFTAQEAGPYSVNVKILFESVAYVAGDSIDIQVVGAGVAHIVEYYQMDASVTEFTGGSGYTEFKLAVNDTIYVQVGNSRTGGSTNLHNDVAHNFIEIKKIG